MDVATLYFHEPDYTGHKYGPDSEEVLQKVEEMDGVLGYLMEQFDRNNLWNSLNLIVTSDHGMTNVDHKNKAIDITQLASVRDSIDFTIGGGPIMNIMPKGNVTDLVNRLSAYNMPMQVYLKKDIPEYWHNKNNRRVLPVVAVADEGWSIVKVCSYPTCI